MADGVRRIRYFTANELAACAEELCAATSASEFACVPNLGYVFAPHTTYPLAPVVRPPLKRIAAFATDMDGTSTTTEPLALHALEYMVRRFTGRPQRADWEGLDRQRDLPHVIGNSNYRHTEFLVDRHGGALQLDALREAFFEALIWTLAHMDDAQRRREVCDTARRCGLGDLLADSELSRFDGRQDWDGRELAARVAPLVRRWGAAFQPAHRSELVSAALDVYYYRYHSMLRAVDFGRGAQLSEELLGESGRRLIEPMPGYDVFLTLAKGWLGGEADALFEMLWELSSEDQRDASGGAQACRSRFKSLSACFARDPARVALVTASIAYEAHVTMKEVIRQVAERATSWPVSAACRDRIAAGLSDYVGVFDAFVTASDACEHRLKPHPDLYSLALHRMSLPCEAYPACVGLEDTEPGIVALRAAGVGCAIALPNTDTQRQDYRAAAAVIPGGLPELLLCHDLAQALRKDD